MYSTGGWTMHHATDVFGKTGIIDGIQWGTSPLAAAWLCTHLWEHYRFTGDRDFLKGKAYPIMKEAIQFIQGFLIKDQNGYLVTAPSVSPENSFKMPDGTAQQLTYAPSIDVQTVMELYNACIEAAPLVGESETFVQELKNTLRQLPPVRISPRYGIVQEWIKDYEEAEPGHRHMSQLIGLYPFSLITPKTPELFAAARKTIERRLQHGGGHTGWSRAWIINFFARLQDGNAAHQNLVALLQKSTLPNLFDNHPPFQIDGNFGATAGIAEMLLQSHAGEFSLLPALPSEWPNGAMHGLVARGGFEINLDWSNGILNNVRILSKLGNPCVVRYGEKTITLKTKKGGVYTLNGKLQRR
jgi:alpha-L-fucosidase 2